jgi:hypothetical protein
MMSHGGPLHPKIHLYRDCRKIIAIEIIDPGEIYD